jgi:hypothetical protein
MNIEDVLINIFGSFVVSLVLKITDKFIDKKKESKNNYLDISSTRQKKTLCNIIHPNTQFTWTGNGFDAHL